MARRTSHAAKRGSRVFPPPMVAATHSGLPLPSATAVAASQIPGETIQPSRRTAATAIPEAGQMGVTSAGGMANSNPARETR